MTRALVIGYGNPFRGDDAAGWVAAHQIAERFKDDVELIVEQQLAPEMAEAISRARRVVFVDAASEGKPGELQCRTLSASGALAGPMDHRVSPDVLLTYAKVLFGRCPPAAIFSVAAETLEFGQELSETVSRALPRLVAAAGEWLHPAHTSTEVSRRA